MDLLKQRKIGILPEIDIAGHSYTVDLRLNELRNVEFPTKKLSLDEMVTATDGQHYLFFYDRESRSILHASSEMVNLPKNAVLVEIPDEMGLDPVGMARKYGLGDEYFLKMHPYGKGLKSKVTPMDKSGLPEFVVNNLKQHRQDPQKIPLRKSQ
ncbi:hypothetical protein U3A58_17455 [Algoriphagus sp. C2-6-M1]|uniref:hypothetical protein n=1 Tax=Algoriphagus persicinus TaxID=3108754 RepID=UPI002B3CFCE1|nr:hypothetical protein [Algoriphagus sp. C2-6-M1]MEB2782183.1 hypothetical protein [Algoriphagus sp. C2-6-M1]